MNAISQNGSTPILLAASSRRPDSLEAMKLLLAHGADVRAKIFSNITVLAQSVRSGNAEKVKLVLSRGVDINARMRNGRTALMMATDIYGTSPEVVKVLLEHGADVNAQDIHGDTALSRAERNHHDAEIRLLRAAGAKEPPPSLNRTPSTQAPVFGGAGPRTSQ